MAQDHRYRPQLLRNGVIVQSGIDLRPRHQRAHLLSPTKRPYRAVVVNTRVSGEDGHLRGLGVECDVVLIHSQIAIQNVPVLQRQHGVNNVHDLWTPRQSTRIVGEDGQPLNTDRVLSRRGTYNAPASPLGSLDGDQVLVDFIEGNQDYPIIIGALYHEQTNRTLTPGGGWREGSTEERGSPKRDEYYLHHYGAEVRINEQGDLLIDTVGAYSDPATEDAAAASGQVRIRVKEGQRLTVAMGDDEDVLEVYKDGAQVRVDLGEGADQRIPLGDDWYNAMSTFLTAFSTFAGAIAVAPVNLGTPAVQLDPASLTAIQNAATTLDTALSAALSDLARTKKT